VLNRSIKRIFHADHGIPPFTALQVIQSLDLPDGFFLRTTELPEGAPDVLNALYGPAAGDSPVPESDVFYAQRSPDRPESRMIDLPKRPTRIVTVIGVADPNGVTVYTIHGGPAADREPGDKSLASDPEALAASKAFWSKHALAAR
jgi:hypothetical protein